MFIINITIIIIYLPYDCLWCRNMDHCSISIIQVLYNISLTKSHNLSPIVFYAFQVLYQKTLVLKTWNFLGFLKFLWMEILYCLVLCGWKLFSIAHKRYNLDLFIINLHCMRTNFLVFTKSRKENIFLRTNWFIVFQNIHL